MQKEKNLQEGIMKMHTIIQLSKERLLMPLGPNGNLQYETISHNLITDMSVHNEPLLATQNMIFIVDGTFLLKKTLRIYLITKSL